MKPDLTCGVATLALCAIFAPPLMAQEISACQAVPPNPGSSSSFVLRCSGQFPTPGYVPYLDCLNFCDCYLLQTNHLRITINYSQLPGDWPQIFTPWQQDVNICGLGHGGYRATVVFAPMTTGLTTTTTTSFVVGSPVISKLGSWKTNVWFGWQSAASLLYCVQFASSAATTSWTYAPAFSNVAGDGFELRFYTTPSNEWSRTYRLFVTPK